MRDNWYTFPFSGPLYRAEQTRALDRLAVASSGISGFELMTRAGQSAFSVMQQHWPEAENIVVFCGTGNNGGDGLVIATLALEQGFAPTVLIVGDDDLPGKFKGEALEALQQAEQQGVNIQRFSPADHNGFLKSADLIIDALLGTGLTGTVRNEYQQAIDLINQSRAPVLAVDIPSGIDSDTGKKCGCAVVADITVSFIGLKQGLMTHQGLEHRGQLLFDDLGVDRDVYDQVEVNTSLIDQRLITQALPPRGINAHKGSNGHVLIIAGDAGMAGAGIMAAESALLSGAGLVTLATRPEHVTASNVRCPEVVAAGVRNGHDVLPLIERADVVLIGPGLGQSPWSESLLQILVKQLSQQPKPSVWDADALNLLAVHPHWHSSDALRIITPHPGEAARLLDCQTGEVQDDRFTAVTLLQERFGGVAMLKGAGSLVAAGSGVLVCQRGNPGMATGGMGDVLSGIIAALYAQGLPAHLATAVAVHIHAQAADIQAELTGQRGLRATALLPHLGRLLNPSQLFHF